jgi:hypothetical protein
MGESCTLTGKQTLSELFVLKQKAINCLLFQLLSTVVDSVILFLSLVEYDYLLYSV